LSSEDSVSTENAADSSGVGLQRTVSLMGGVALIAGTMIGE